MEASQTKYLNYKKYGTGGDHLLAFHGFGQDASVFELFEPSLGTKYTILSFDLFFHGMSSWPVNELPVPVGTWVTMLDSVLIKEKVEKFTVMGFSLGGKLALTTAMVFPMRTKEVILIAPDGIYLNPWYKVATGTSMSRSLFHYLNERPALLIKMISRISKLKLISERLGKFAISQVADKKNGKRIYYSWVGFRPFTQKIKEVVDTVNQNDIRLTMVAGKYDTVIPHNRLKAFKEKCNQSTFVLIKTGHNSLLKKYHELLLENLEPTSSNGEMY